MKWADVKSIPWRVKTLVTGKLVWVDAETGEEFVERSRYGAWIVAKPWVHNWWWVRRWGQMPCGCTRNPLTRRVILYEFDCSTHRAWRREPAGED
jgi:hypothetical protein